MKNLIIDANPEPKLIRLMDFPRILSRKNTWYLMDEQLDIWFTEAIPGTSMMSDSMLEELYLSYGMYWLFGIYVDTDCGKKCAVTKALNMYEVFHHGMEGDISIDGAGTVYGEFWNGRKLRSFGTVLIADPNADVRNGKMAQILHISEENPFTFYMEDLMKSQHTNEPDDLFARSDKKLENMFLEDFNKLYHKYTLTNRGGDMERVLQKIAEKLLY